MAILTKNISLLTKSILDNEPIAFPTETFFALGMNGTNPENIAKIFSIKGRDKNNPISLLINDPNQIYNFSKNIPDIAKNLMNKYWPGPLTAVIELDQKIDSNITSNNGTAGFRIPDNHIALSLLKECNVPITGTSANRSGKPPHKSPIEVSKDIGKDLKFIYDEVCGEKNYPSTVIDFTKKPYKIVREGSIPFSEITNLYGKDNFCIK